MNQFEDKYHDHTVYERRLHDEASRIFTLEIQAKPLIEKAKIEERSIFALNLHAEGFDIPKIIKLTNLAEEEVRKIIENP